MPWDWWCDYCDKKEIAHPHYSPPEGWLVLKLPQGQDPDFMYFCSYSCLKKYAQAQEAEEGLKRNMAG